MVVAVAAVTSGMQSELELAETEDERSAPFGANGVELRALVLRWALTSGMGAAAGVVFPGSL
jgi:hypothetical protein